MNRRGHGGVEATVLSVKVQKFVSTQLLLETHGRKAQPLRRAKNRSKTEGGDRSLKER